MSSYETTCGPYGYAPAINFASEILTTPTLPLLKCVVLAEGGETRICENTDNGAKNIAGYSCVDVAIVHNHGYNDVCRSEYDTPTFTASSMCCACGGGQTIRPFNTASETCEHTSETHLDIEGDTCTHYRKYYLGQGCDGTYDDDDFTASEMCCGCSGGSAPTTSACVDTELDARDRRGAKCYNGNYDSGNICGLYDDVDFTATQMCCDCGGGFRWDLGSLDEEWDASAPYCYDDTENGQLDSFWRSMFLLFYLMSLLRRLSDDSDFTASEMCCACGGGDTRICENTDNGAKNSYGRSCVDVAIFDTIMDTRRPANQTSTPPPSPPPPCAARVVEDKPSFPPPTHRKPANTPREITSISKETRVRTIASIISDKDVTEPTMTMTLQRVRCVVGVMVMQEECDDSIGTDVRMLIQRLTTWLCVDT